MKDALKKLMETTVRGLKKEGKRTDARTVLLNIQRFDEDVIVTNVADLYSQYNYPKALKKKEISISILDLDSRKIQEYSWGSFNALLTRLKNSPKK